MMCNDLGRYVFKGRVLRTFLALFLAFSLFTSPIPSFFKNAYGQVTSSHPEAFVQYYDEDGVPETFRPNSPVTFASPDQELVVGGRVDQIDNCHHGGINDFIGAYSDIYIIDSAPREIPVDGKTVLIPSVIDGQELTDVRGQPSPVGDSTGISFDYEPIAFLPPDGKGLQDGHTYSIVIDNCQDNHYNSDEDVLIPDAFTINLNDYDPAIQAHAFFEMHKLKDEARLKQVALFALQKQVLGAYAAMKTGLANAITSRCVSLITQAPEAVDVITKACVAMEGLAVYALNLYLGVKVDPLVNDIKADSALANDPPDTNYQQLTAIFGLNNSTNSTSNDPFAISFNQVGNQLANEAAITNAILQSFERYQGAEMNGNPKWTVTHLMEMKRYFNILQSQTHRTDDLLTSLDSVLSNNTGGPQLTSADIPAILASQQQVAAHGFNSTLIRDLKNSGFTDTDINQIQNTFVSFNFSSVTNEELSNEIQKIKTLDASMIPTLQALSNNSTNLIDNLARTYPFLSFSSPIANAGGPYVATEGNPLVLNGSTIASQPRYNITKYEWDLKGDGKFDDATGPTPSVTFNKAFTGYVGLRISDSFGHSGIAYAPITVVKLHPKITSIFPNTTFPAVLANTSLPFSISVSQAEVDPVKISWLLDGSQVAASANNTFIYHPTSNDIGFHTIEADVKDANSIEDGTIKQVWQANVITPDKDHDGWNANLDCNDNDPSINPGMKEIIGNGKDDDCNPNTPDNGRPPITFFSPQSTEERNVALLEAGAQVINSTGSPSTLTPPSKMLDYSNSTSDFYWGSKSATNQWAKILLAGLPQNKAVGGYLIDKVKVMPYPDKTTTANVRDFEIAVSNSTSDDSAFKTVFHGTVLNNGQLQEFALPKAVLAKYVKYSPLNNYGSTTSIITHQLKVMTAQQTSNHTISFKNLSTDPDNDIVSWNWNFGDKSANSTEINPVHTFPTGTGTYNVTLTVVDSTGQSSKFSAIQKILSGPPTPAFTYTPTIPNEGAEVHFTDNSVDPDGGKIVYRKWDWGDKTISAGALPTAIGHNFPDNGLYPVKLTIVDDQEEASQVTRFVQVLNVPPRVNLGLPQTIYDGAQILIQPGIFDPAFPVDNLTYQWDFGDGSPILTLKSASLIHEYTLNDPADSTQKFNATLTATDKDGGVGKDTLTYTVNPDNQGPKPPANATILLNDNFNRENKRNPTLCYDAACSHLLNWDVKKGSVDVIGINSGFDFQPGYGLYIDLDGSGTGPGKLVSKKTFSLTPGNYTLQFDLAGSFRGDTNKVIVSLGNLYNESFTLPSNSPYQTIKRNIVVHTPTNASLIFDHYDVSPPTFDTYGLLLDNVKLYSTDPKVKNLNHAPIARNDSATTKEGIPVAINVLSNDTDIDNDPIHTAKITKQPLHGTAHINNDDTITYGPNSRFFGKDSFIYGVSDSRGGNANGTVSVTVNHVNHIPKAVDSKNIVTNEDTPITAILNGNDDDLTYNETSIPLKFSIVNGPTSGTLSSISAINSTSARVTYTPNLHLYGNDKFTFKVNDGIADSTNVGTVPITVNHINHPPITNDKNISTKAGIPTNVTLTATDIDKDPLTFSIVNGPTSGTLSSISAINSTSARVTYTPVNLTFVGKDAFSYRVSDGKGGNATAAVNVNVRPSNIPPIANDLTISTTKNKPVNFTLTGSDADQDQLTFVGLSGPHNGLLNLNSTTGLARYTPLPHFHGPDNFTFAVNDGKVLSQPATVSITVNDDGSNDPPQAVSERTSTNENTPKNIDVLANDIDPNHDPLSIKNIIEPFHGSAKINQNNNTVTYMPNHNFVGRDAFFYNVTDGKGGLSAAQTIVDVLPVNQPPMANDRIISVNETNKPISVTLFGTDPEGSALTFSIVSNPSGGGMLSSVRPINGTSANVTFTPKTNFTGTDSFTYKANDGALDSNVATIKIDINPIFINHPPVAVNDKATTNENTSVNINVLANDTDLDHDLLKVTGITTQPKNGDAVFNANNNTITYTPANNFFGQDTFAYNITDGHPGGTATATVRITVNHINHAPIANAGPDQTVNENTSNVTLNGTRSSDPDKGDTISSYSWKQISGTPIVTLTGNNTSTPTFTAPSVTADTALKFNLTVTDNYGATSKPDTVTITVKNVNLPPVANAGANQTVNENTTNVILDGSASSDKDGNIKSYSWTQTSGPSVPLTGGNTSKATFTAPSVVKDTTLTFKLAVTDNDNATSFSTTNVLVKNVNIPAIANAGTNQTVNENTTGVTLNASKSYDPDGRIVSYLWTQTSGPIVLLSNPNSASTTFTAPSVTKDTSLTFRLTVKDDVGANSSATTNVLVKNVNLSPIANAGTNQTVNENTTGVRLDGTKSFDKDGTITSYLWTQTAGPSVALTGASTATPTFTAPSVTKDTTLTFKLTVTDNDGASFSSSTNVIVKNINIPPIAVIGPNQVVNESKTVWHQK